MTKIQSTVLWATLIISLLGLLLPQSGTTLLGGTTRSSLTTTGNFNADGSINASSGMTIFGAVTYNGSTTLGTSGTAIDRLSCGTRTAVDPAAFVGGNSSSSFDVTVTGATASSTGQAYFASFTTSTAGVLIQAYPSSSANVVNVSFIQYATGTTINVAQGTITACVIQK